MRPSNLTALCATVSAIGLGCLPGASWAQAQAPAAGRVDEVIVTAQRRAQPIQDVPISIQAFSTEKLAQQGVYTTRDLMTNVPGLNMSYKGLFAQPVLRGISTQGTGVDAAVATYIDGVYMAATAAAIFELSDIEDVEVLKGPQGTLYGRNATGGAILLRTKKPSYDFAGSASASYGSYNDRQANFYLTGPIRGDFLAASISGLVRARDGYTDDLLRGGKIGKVDGEALRLSLRAKFTDAFEVVGSAYKTRLSDPNAYTGIALGQNSLSRRVAPTIPIATRPFTSSSDFLPYTEAWIDGATVNAYLDLGWGKVTSTTGYVHALADGNQDADAGPVVANHIKFTFPNRTKSQEISVSTKEFGKVSFIFGGMVFQQDQASEVIVGGVNHIFGKQKNTAYAGYAESEWKITDRLTGIAGVRYSWEERQYQGFLGTGPLRPTNLIAKATKSWDAFTPRLTLSYKLNDDVNLYGTYNEGFKSGTFNPTSLITRPADPEHVKAFELGAKTSYGRSTLNVALFDYDFQNMQVASTVTTGTLTQSFLNNAAAAKITGIEIEGGVWLTDSFRISGGVTHLRARFESFKSATANVPFSPAQCSPGVWPCGNFSTVLDVSGAKLTRTPDTTATLTAEYISRLFGGQLHSSATYYYNSGFPWEVSGRVKQGAYSTLAATAVWTPDAYPAVELSVWGRNLTDEIYANQAVDSAGGDIISFGLPRMIGVRAAYRF